MLMKKRREFRSKFDKTEFDDGENEKSESMKLVEELMLITS